MTRIANALARTYQSELRAEQAEATRIRILDATVRVMARGIATLSIPAVAREAGVSVPTVYRHFGTKHELLAAVHPHLGRRTGISQLPTPHTVEEFHALVRRLVEGQRSFANLELAAALSPVGQEARKVVMPERLAMIRRFVKEVAPKARPTDQERIARAMLVLTQSGALRVWHNYLALGSDVAADDIDWMLRAAIAYAQGRKKQ